MPDEYTDRYELCENEGMRAAPSANADAAPILVYTSVYNIRESYLRRAIESVLNQTFTNFRYLLIDNGSTDGSASILKEYAKKDRRIEVFTFEKNIQLARLTDMGYAKTATEQRVSLLKEKGEKHKYYCSLDSDDYYMPDFLKTTYELAERFNADIVAGHTQLYLEENPEIRYFSGAPLETSVYKGKRQVANALFDNFFIWRVVWGKLVRFRLHLEARSQRTEAETSSVGDATDVLNNFTKLDLAETVVMSNELLHHYTLRPQSQARTMRKNTRTVTRMHYLHEWLINFAERSAALSHKNALKINDFVLNCIFDLDLPIINKTKDTDPELTIEVIRYIIQQEVPDELKSDRRMDIIHTKLNEILAHAENKVTDR
jgi:glycosyltransferase involved in cell wall biosynthesis